MATIEEASKALAPFLESNPASTLEQEGERILVRKPWGDPSMILDLGECDDESIVAQLNALMLPSRFSALYHEDEHAWEFIYIAYTDGMIRDANLDERKFDFTFRGKDYVCAWDASSDRLLTLASIVRPAEAPVATSYRNLPNYLRYLAKLDEYEGETPDADVGFAQSFWIRCQDLSLAPDEDEFVDVARHLNFFMNFYDQRSPLIAVHEQQQKSDFKPLPRFPRGDFPVSMTGRDLDPYLISLWEASLMESDANLRFLYNYQVLEYAAFFHLKRDTVERVRRVLATPDIAAKPEATAQRMIDLMAVEANRQEEDKLVELLKDVVDPASAWAAVEANKSFFATETVFDGGYRLDALLPKEDCDFEYFKQHWLPKFPNLVRRLRNALVHARDSRGDGRLAPSAGNAGRIRVWIEPLQATVADVLLYGYTQA